MELSKENKKTCQQIKKLIQSRDTGQIAQAIELAKKTASVAVFDELLGDVNYNNRAKFSNHWKGTGPDEYYFSLAIQGLINFAPEGSKGQLMRDSFDTLRLEGITYNGSNRQSTKIYACFLTNFTNLRKLEFDSFYEIIGLEEIFHLNIESLSISNVEDYNATSANYRGNGIFPIQKWKFKNLQDVDIQLPNNRQDKKGLIYNLDFLSELNSLKKLKVTNWTYDSEEFSVSGIKNLTKIEYLNIEAGIKSLEALENLCELKLLKIKSDLLENLNGLSNASKLLAINFYGCEKLKDISKISNSTAIEYIDLGSCKSLSDLKSLGKLNKLQFLDISNTSVKTLEGVNEAINLRAINLQGSFVTDFDPLIKCEKIAFVDGKSCLKLKSVRGLQKCANLKAINLVECSSLLSLEGLENCKELNIVQLSGSGVKNVQPLMYCLKIENNERWSDSLHVELTEKLKKYFSDLGITTWMPLFSLSFGFSGGWTPSQGKHFNLNQFIIQNCPNLESMEGLKNAGIQYLYISNCSNLKNVDSLSEFNLLQVCDFSDSPALENVKGVVHLPLLEQLILGKCVNVKPKPRFLQMDSFEKLHDYLEKFKTGKPKIKISDEKKEINKKLEDLLLANDYAQIDLGLDLANTINDAEIFNALLQDVKFLKGTIIPNSVFLVNNNTKIYRTYALEGLLSIAPDSIETARIYKSSFTTKDLSGDRFSNLLSISGLTNLVELSIRNTSIKSLSDIQKLVNIEKLILFNNSHLSDLSGLKECKKLKSIEINSCGIVNLKNISTLPSLSSITVNQCDNLSSADGLENLTSLTSIDLSSNPMLENIDSLGNLNTLGEISLNNCPSIKNIQAITKLNALHVLNVEGHNFERIDNISSLTKPILEGLRKK